MRILLISNSGRPYFGHCRNEISAFLNVQRTAFITAASLNDEDEYFALVQESLMRISDGNGVGDLLHLRWNQGGLDVLEKSDAVFVGGGNTFVLLQRLRQAKLLEPLREVVKSGIPYIGSSAGANLVGPNVLTSNDWNVVALTSFGALGLVPFSVNPHYVERPEAPTAETRDHRIHEYHRIHSNPVLAIEEDSLLRVENGVVRVVGTARARIFRRNTSPTWLESGEQFDMESLSASTGPWT